MERFLSKLYHAEANIHIFSNLPAVTSHAKACGMCPNYAT